MSGIVVDTSAIVAIVRTEPPADWLISRLQDADERTVSAPTALELGMVLEGGRPGSVGIARSALREADIQIEAFDADLAERAMQAWRRFGKGRHPAGLNFGDCCTFALAARRGEAILCLGDDFARTDAKVVRPPELTA